ncbi:MAG: TIGR04086 family membrane protein [Bacilli bacterium]|nr:TIGR04086 family membrane protein [Bacilli bacterium]MDD4547558.1 TIGR04086 family membrane protein [Bacilli bacterium]
MIFLKNSIKPLLAILISLLLLTFIATSLNYFNLINYKVISILKLIIPIVSFIIGGFIIGTRSISKGWLAGLKLCLVFLIFLTLFNLLGLQHKFKLIDLIYYLILIGSTMFGSMIGINKRKPTV